MSLGDLLYNLTDWLRGTQLIELSLWISETPFSLLIQTNFWAIPTIQTLHILAIGALFGSALMINLRVLGVVGMHRSLPETAARFAPWIRWALVGLVISGLLLIIGEPIRELINSVFWVKMALILITVAISFPFNRKVSKADGAGSAGSLRVGAILLIILWCAIMAGGRWIAYAPV